MVLLYFQIYINPGIFECIFCRIGIQIFNCTVELPSVCPDHHRIVRQFRHNGQPPCLKTFIELTTRLVQQFYQIDGLHIQLDISGTDL